MTIDEIIQATGLSHRQVVCALRGLVVDPEGALVSYHHKWFGSGWRRCVETAPADLSADCAFVWAVLPL